MVSSRKYFIKNNLPKKESVQVFVKRGKTFHPAFGGGDSDLSPGSRKPIVDFEEETSTCLVVRSKLVPSSGQNLTGFQVRWAKSATPSSFQVIKESGNRYVFELCFTKHQALPTDKNGANGDDEGDDFVVHAAAGDIPPFIED